MRPDPFREDDGQEPDPSQELDDGSFFAVYDSDLAQQGLFLNVPAGSFDTDHFAQSGPAEDMPPDPLLATVIDTIASPGGSGLPGLSDDQLVGVLAATRRLESRAAWYVLTATAEFGARYGSEVAGAEFAADQLACELHLTPRSAAAQLDYAQSVTERLPHYMAALAAGRLFPVHLRIIEDETSVLSPEDVATADLKLADCAGSLTYGRLRAAAHRLVLELDPESAERRKQAARQDAHVRPFRESSGNAGLIASELPSAEVLASWQHIEQRALDLRAAGLDGTLQALRVRAYLDLLQGRDARQTLVLPDSASTRGDSAPPGFRPSGTGPSGPSAPDNGLSLAAMINITVPWSSATGQSNALAEIDHLGLVDAADARDLLAAAAQDPRTRWCVTTLHPDGTAAAHGCATGRHPPPRTGQRPATSTPGPPDGPDPPPGVRPQDWLGIKLTRIARDTCAHDHAETGYQPSRKLRHLVRARNARCSAPGCSRPAARCDLDHTLAWEHGGLTCECDLAPLCRHHHRCKQAEGWQLDQPEPGVLIWRTPAGRTYATRPTQYPA